jgi:hypothetical protein
MTNCPALVSMPPHTTLYDATKASILCILPMKWIPTGARDFLFPKIYRQPRWSHPVSSSMGT